jgi:hypothetical protein
VSSSRTNVGREAHSFAFASSICLWTTQRKKPIYTQAVAHGFSETLSETEGLIRTPRWITALGTLRYSDLFASGEYVWICCGCSAGSHDVDRVVGWSYSSMEGRSKDEVLFRYGELLCPWGYQLITVHIATEGVIRRCLVGMVGD